MTQWGIDAGDTPDDGVHATRIYPNRASPTARAVTVVSVNNRGEQNAGLSIDATQ